MKDVSSLSSSTVTQSTECGSIISASLYCPVGSEAQRTGADDTADTLELLLL